MRMRIDRKRFYLTGLVALLFVLSACGASSLASSPPTPAQLLQNSAKAMSQLKSVHLDLQASLNLQPNTTSNSPSGMTFNVTGHGDVAAPDDVSLNLALGQSPLVAVISKGQTVYVQTQGGTWYSVAKSQVKGSMQNFFSQSLTTRLGQLMATLQQAKLTDHGMVLLNGQSVDHITATLDQQTLQQLNTQLNSLLPTNSQSAQNAITQASLDLWIDPATNYVHQAQLDVVANIDTGALQKYTGQNTGSSSTALPISLKAQLNFSKFNQPVTIQAPASSTPLQQ